MNRKHIEPVAEVLPADIAGAFATAGRPHAPSDARKADMAQRLMARVRSERTPFLTVRRDDGQWQQLAPDIAIKVLDSDESMQAFLLRLDQGACLPGHPHADDEMCYVIEGDARLGEVEVRAGDYHMARAGTAHGDITTRNGCLLLIRYGSAPHPHRQPAV